ncbi:hypothetical protein [Terrabacter sp. 2RAF25]|uniref:hypothetical protein n=1 Tax=Terrabacter sp. 2RAF25 TaxID=3232998 RepID=UPI003F9A081E
MIKRLCVSLASGAIAVVALAPAASAAATPIGSTCDDGTSIVLVFNGGGNFTPGHLVGGTATYVTQSIDATRVFTPTVGPVEVTEFHVVKPHVAAHVTTCVFDLTRVTPTGTFHAFGTSTFLVTPNS